MNKIKDLPKYDRPREKAIRFGIETLSTEELLALILGFGTKDIPVLELAHSLMRDSNGLFNLFSKSFESLLEFKGIGKGKALLLSACFELSKRYDASRFMEDDIVDIPMLYQRYAPRLRGLNKEVFIIIILNSKQKIIHEETFYKGGEERVDCSPLEIIKKVILHGGKSFYIMHNHPSGNCLPSVQDVDLTTDIITRSYQVRIKMIDHIIIGGDAYYSFNEAFKLHKKGQKRLIKN